MTLGKLCLPFPEGDPMVKQFWAPAGQVIIWRHFQFDASPSHEKQTKE